MFLETVKSANFAMVVSTKPQSLFGPLSLLVPACDDLAGVPVSGVGHAGDLLEQPRLQVKHERLAGHGEAGRQAAGQQDLRLGDLRGINDINKLVSRTSQMNNQIL